MHNQKNILYIFYRRNRNGRDEFIGSLIERRKSQERITHYSIMNWARLLTFKDVFEERVYFIRVETQLSYWHLQKLKSIELSINGAGAETALSFFVSFILPILQPREDQPFSPSPTPCLAGKD